MMMMLASLVLFVLLLAVTHALRTPLSNLPRSIAKASKAEQLDRVVGINRLLPLQVAVDPSSQPPASPDSDKSPSPLYLVTAVVFALLLLISQYQQGSMLSQIGESHAKQGLMLTRLSETQAKQGSTIDLLNNTYNQASFFVQGVTWITVVGGFVLAISNASRENKAKSSELVNFLRYLGEERERQALKKERERMEAARKKERERMEAVRKKEREEKEKRKAQLSGGKTGGVKK